MTTRHIALLPTIVTAVALLSGCGGRATTKVSVPTAGKVAVTQVAPETKPDPSPLPTTGADDPQLIEAMEKLNAKVVRDEQHPDKVVMLISFDRGTAGDTELAMLKGTPQVKQLFLTNSKVTDAGLAQLKELKKLERLSLVNTGITDAGLAHLKEIKSLRFVSLTNTKVTDDGIKDFQKAMPAVQIDR